jgi:hypothetical protein
VSYIETCIRHGCHEVATHTTVNGAFCDEHPADPRLCAEPTNYSPEVVEAYRQGVRDALDNWGRG